MNSRDVQPPTKSKITPRKFNEPSLTFNRLGGFPMKSLITLTWLPVMSLHCCRGRVQMFKARWHFTTTNPEVFLLQLMTNPKAEIQLCCFFLLEKFQILPQTSPTLFWVSYVLFLVQKSEGSVVFDAFNNVFFSVKKKNGRKRRREPTGPSRTVGIEDEEPRAEGFNVLPLTT